jgi:hypothetical protein
MPHLYDIVLYIILLWIREEQRWIREEELLWIREEEFFGEARNIPPPEIFLLPEE